MYRIIFLLSTLSLLSACSSVPMQGINKGPRGITIINIQKQERNKAYREAERHCAKYSKVPLVVKVVKQDADSEYAIDHLSIMYDCLRPTR